MLDRNFIKFTDFINATEQPSENGCTRLLVLRCLVEGLSKIATRDPNVSGLSGESLVHPRPLTDS